MILVDSSVWIDFFRRVATPEAEKLDSLLGAELVATGDLILAELQHGFTHDRNFNQVRKLLTSLVIVDLAGQAVAIQAATNSRTLRPLGNSVRKTVDTLIATHCIENRLALLYSDRDFEPFVEHLGLRSACSTVHSLSTLRKTDPGSRACGRRPRSNCAMVRRRATRARRCACPFGPDRRQSLLQ